MNRAGFKPAQGVLMKVDEMEPQAGEREGCASPGQPLLLSQHVRLAVLDYLARLDADQVSSLYAMVLHEVERPLIQAVMEQCGQNQSKAAQMLGLSRSTLRKKMASFGPP
jgi:Fis family transcriptional regulator